MNNSKKNEILENAQSKFAEGKLLDSLSLLEQLDEYSGLKLEVRLLKARIIHLKKDKLRGVLSDESGNIEKNRIMVLILELFELIQGSNRKSKSRRKEITLITELIAIIDTTFNTWRAQTKLKEKLIESLESRFEVSNFDTPYELFSHFYCLMNERELRLHKTIRGYTKNIILNRNIEMLELLKENASLKKSIPKLSYLEQHLSLWKSKYDSIFENDESVCLIFVGLEEGMQFPPNLLTELKMYIKKEEKG